jgi:hypothetical protein
VLDEHGRRDGTRSDGMRSSRPNRDVEARADGDDRSENGVTEHWK